MAKPGSKTAIQKIAFDTDVLIWYFRGHRRAWQFIEAAPYPARSLSSLTVMELLQGCRNRNEIHNIRSFVAENFMTILHPDESVSRRAIELLQDYALAGGLRVIDAMIAATALETDHALATANVRHYRFIPRLTLVPFRPLDVR